MGLPVSQSRGLSALLHGPTSQGQSAEGRSQVGRYHTTRGGGQWVWSVVTMDTL